MGDRTKTVQALAIRQFDTKSKSLAAIVAELKVQLSPGGDVVSERGREKTRAVFGADLSPRQVVERICDDVRDRGVAAVLDYSLKLDGAKLHADALRVPDARLSECHRKAAPEFLRTVRNIRRNVLEYQQAILHKDVRIGSADHTMRLRHRPLRRVGVCIPGGSAAYPSTLLMTVVPAQAAGVAEIAIVSPPTPFGADNPDMLATCHELGVREVYRIGGAQGVAALAYGVDGVPAVDKIVGPGNLFVALAKQRVSEVVGIDSMAGPSEVVLIVDETAEPRFVAADLLAQAEHAPGASILVSTSRPLADAVGAELERQLPGLERSEPTHESLQRFGAIVVVKDEAEACALSNALAPEHLHLMTHDVEATLGRVEAAGAIFLGNYTPVAVGDYVAGPSHTLPTGGSARFANGLSANDFLVRQAVIAYTAAKLRATADDVRVMANKEGLTAHRRSVDLRLE